MVKKSNNSSKKYKNMSYAQKKTSYSKPKSSTKRLEDGTLVSPPLEDLAPFLPREELRKLMVIPLMEDE